MSTFVQMTPKIFPDARTLMGASEDFSFLSFFVQISQLIYKLHQLYKSLRYRCNVFTMYLEKISLQIARRNHQISQPLLLGLDQLRRNRFRQTSQHSRSGVDVHELPRNPEKRRVVAGGLPRMTTVTYGRQLLTLKKCDAKIIVFFSFYNQR